MIETPEQRAERLANNERIYAARAARREFDEWLRGTYYVEHRFAQWDTSDSTVSAMYQAWLAGKASNS